MDGWLGWDGWSWERTDAVPEDPSEPTDGPHGRAVEWDLVAGERDVPAALARFRDADMMRRVGRALRGRGTRI